jgi:hypothetical protein
LVLFIFVVSHLSFNSALTTSASFGWLLLISSGCIDRLVLFCISLAYETALCGSLKGPGHLLSHFLLIVYILAPIWLVLSLLLENSPFFIL